MQIYIQTFFLTKLGTKNKIKNLKDFLSFDNYQYYIKHKNEISIIKFPHNVHIISEMNFSMFP